MSKSSSRGGQNNNQGNRQGSGDSKPAHDNRTNQLHPNQAPTKPAASNDFDAEDLAEDFGGHSNG